VRVQNVFAADKNRGGFDKLLRTRDLPTRKSPAGWSSEVHAGGVGNARCVGNTIILLLYTYTYYYNCSCRRVL